MIIKRVIFLMIFAPGVLLGEEAIFKAEKTCVAYKTVKGMAWVTEVDVIGRNCKVDLRRTGIPQRFGFKVSARISDFDSGNGKRDEGVAELLKGNVHPLIIFEVAPQSQSYWKSLEQKPQFHLPGLLHVAGKKYPVKFQVRNANGKMRGKLVSTFTNLGIEPPRIGPGGAIADSRDHLELYFLLRLSDLKSETGGF